MTILGKSKKKVGPKEALFWTKENSKIRCTLCPHECNISEGKRGICGVREHINGKLYSLIYGKMTSMSVDPIEKKPLFHFYPGTGVLSFGTVGCNFKCAHCQNWSISQMGFNEVGLRDISAKEVVENAKRYNCKGIAWTYNEPSIWFEFTLDSSIAAKENGLYTAYVTNGFMNKEPLEMIAPYLDAMNIDVKAMNDDFYNKVCKGKLAPVLETVKNAHELGIFVEVTYLIIPTMNDDLGEIEKYCEWVADVDKEIPLHFSRFHPDYKMTSIPYTPMGTMDKAFEIAKAKGLKFVYLGNIRPGDNRENTYCPKCNELLIERSGFSVRNGNLTSDKCPNCGEKINIRI